MDIHTIHEVEQFLYNEARLLDERRFREWLELLTDDIHYWMPMRITTTHNKGSEEIELGMDSLTLLDETMDTLQRRIVRRETGHAYAEDPPSRTRHYITNIEVRSGTSDSELLVFSNFLVYRSRMEKDEDFYFGRREDTLRRMDGALKLSKRKIVLEQNVLLAKNLSVFL